MKTEWFFSRSGQIICPLPHIYRSEAGNLFSNRAHMKANLDGRGVIILLDGYVLPRMKCFERYKAYHDEDLIFRLFQRYQFDFIDYVKGLFVLILAIDGNFHVYSDHLGIRKFFYIIKDHRSVIITSNLKHIAANTQLDIDATNLFINILFNHYIDGRTAFKNVFYSQPASRITLSAENIAFDNYWDVDALLEARRGAYSINFMADFFKSLTRSYVEYFKPAQISLSITGGLDCRQIMAALLANSVAPRTYTYGHLDAIDVHYGRQVAKQMGLEHSHYYPRIVSKNWYQPLVNEIVEKGNSITSIHRAHRLYAIKHESSKCDLMFLGYMGGEIVRGNWPDDLITSAFMRLYWQGKKCPADLIIEHARQNFYKLQGINLQELQSHLASLRFIGHSSKINNFYFLFLVQAFLHYAQDLNLFSHYIKYVVPIFIDIDYLEKIFNSRYSMLFRANLTKSKIRRFKSTYFSCYMIDKMWPRLGAIVLSKGYSPRELLSNKILMLIKRQYRIIRQKTFAPSFKYGTWYYDFFMGHMPACNEVKRFFDVDHALEAIANYSHVFSDERSCLPFTRIIELQLMAKHFGISL
ncbi:MAG: hypothetical protein ACFFCW_48215 [Candidatus Hodarchaeota archaeon]